MGAPYLFDDTLGSEKREVQPREKDPKTGHQRNDAPQVCAHKLLRAETICSQIARLGSKQSVSLVALVGRKGGQVLVLRLTLKLRVNFARDRVGSKRTPEKEDVGLRAGEKRERMK